MRYLLLAVLIGLPALAVADAVSWSSQHVYQEQLESLYRCHWLTAASEEEQSQQSENQDNAGEDDEPDCD